MSAIHAALSAADSLCIHNPSAAMVVTGRGPCNGSVAQLTSGDAQTVSLNHGYQNIAYGLGLMTSIGSAFKGLETIPSVSLSSYEITIARELFEEAQPGAGAPARKRSGSIGGPASRRDQTERSRIAPECLRDDAGGRLRC